MQPLATQKPKRKTFEELSEQAKQDIAVLSQKPDIDAKVEYYKGMLITVDKLAKAIDKQIEFLKLVAPNPATDLEIAKLEIEKLDAIANLSSKKQFFEMWLTRSKDYLLKFQVITEECNRDFDLVLNEAKELAGEGSYLQKYIQNYFTTLEAEAKNMTEMDLQMNKNDFFIFIKFERDKALAPKNR